MNKVEWDQHLSTLFAMPEMFLFISELDGSLRHCFLVKQCSTILCLQPRRIKAMPIGPSPYHENLKGDLIEALY